jgi:hypothetical protein
MWAIFRKAFAGSKRFGATFGDVVFQTPEVRGQASRAFLQWRVKRDPGGDRHFIGLKMLADAYVGPEGSPTNYINFDIERAQRLRFHLSRCIDEYYKLTSEIRPQEDELGKIERGGP